MATNNPTAVPHTNQPIGNFYIGPDGERHSGGFVAAMERRQAALVEGSYADLRHQLAAAKRRYLRVMNGSGEYAGMTLAEYIAAHERALADVRRIEAEIKATPND